MAKYECTFRSNNKEPRPIGEWIEEMDIEHLTSLYLYILTVHLMCLMM